MELNGYRIDEYKRMDDRIDGKRWMSGMNEWKDNDSTIKIMKRMNEW